VKRPHKARRLALQVLCCLDAQGRKAVDLALEFINSSREAEDIRTLAQSLALGAFRDLETIDALLARHARHWQLHRLAMVDRNILRLGTHEMLQGQTPFKVVINEGLLLAQEFSTADSPRFVNGVLDAVAQELNEQMGRSAG
jgi:transcription antitermination factor NusB